MKHIKVTFGKKVYEHDIPTRWDELDAEGLKLAARIWSGAVPRDVLLAQFFGLPDKVVESIDDYLIYCLMQLTTWLQRLDDDVDNFKIEQLPDTEYLSPGPRLSGCTLEQFMIADTNFQRYSISQDADHLTYFIASLYNAKARSDNGMEKKIAAVEQLPEDVRQAVFLNFILIRRWLSRSYPHLFRLRKLMTRKRGRPTNSRKSLALQTGSPSSTRSWATTLRSSTATSGFLLSMLFDL